jgi:glucose-fructose oxidoreductase
MIQEARSRKINYAVVGLGAIAQTAVLPGFANAKNSRIAALISDTPDKLKKLSKKYRVAHTAGYNCFEECLVEAQVDAVYICLPNHLHCDYAMRAARVGVHVLVEKPMALTEAECRDMIRVCADHDVKLMVAYRLHFEKANLEAIKTVTGGKLGEPKYFNSDFSMQVKPGNIRVRRETGGGTLYDIGIYCINAARYLFRQEPIEVQAISSWSGDPRFTEVDECTAAIMRFPGGEIATFTSSFGAASVDSYRIIGSKGDLVVEPAYEYSEPICHCLTVGGKTKERTFTQRDQFGAEIAYFSDCILNNQDPEPSGAEGMADVRIIQALYRSAETHAPVAVGEQPVVERPQPNQQIKRPVKKEPKLVHASEPEEEED